MEQPIEEQFLEQSLLENKLSIINEKLIRRRIKREIEILINDKICLLEDIIIENELDDFNNGLLIKKSLCKIEFKNIQDNKFYSFEIPNFYPFKPPKLSINHKSIEFYHKIMSENFRDSLKKYVGIECFCCQTILCPYNWGPSYTMKDVLLDVKNFQDYTCEVITRLIVDVIKRKYFNKDINIIEWLY